MSEFIIKKTDFRAYKKSLIYIGVLDFLLVCFLYSAYSTKGTNGLLISVVTIFILVILILGITARLLFLIITYKKVPLLLIDKNSIFASALWGDNFFEWTELKNYSFIICRNINYIHFTFINSKESFKKMNLLKRFMYFLNTKFLNMPDINLPLFILGEESNEVLNLIKQYIDILDE